MSFAAEPQELAHFRHAPEQLMQHTAVLLVNLGTPDAPTPEAVRRYLAEFLSDPRVVEIPRALWWPILHGLVLRTRPAKSAAKYQAIWSRDGSPLKVITEQQAKLLGGYLGERGQRVTVRCAMRYGSPAIASALDELKAQGHRRILILPLYPQYSASTTASVYDAVYRWASRQRLVPELRFVAHYHDHPGYIGALAAGLRREWRKIRPQHLVMSFHGVPERTLRLGDPYYCECLKTARLLAEELALGPEAWTVTFQSRFGKARWLQPATRPTLVRLARQGCESVQVICPGFAADCLETLEEIAIEGRAAFLQAGGQQFEYTPCLNTDSVWMRALTDLTLQHLAGWPTDLATVRHMQAAATPQAALAQAAARQTSAAKD